MKNKYSIIFFLSSLFLTSTKSQLCPIIMDLAVIVDSSGSIDIREFEQISDTLIDFFQDLDLLNQESYIGIIDFGYQPFLEQMFVSNDDDKFVLERKVHNLAYFGRSTSLELALAQSLNDIFKVKKGNNNTPQILMILTDGVADEEFGIVEARMNEIKALGVRVFVVEVGSERSDQAMLNMLASTPLSNYRVKFNEFMTLKSRINTLTRGNCGKNAFFP